MILLGFVASESVLAGPHGRGGVRFSLAVGVPFGYYGYRYYYPPSYYYPPYYSPYYAPAVAVPYSPPTYVEQSTPQYAPAPQAAPGAQSSPAPQNLWYYCADSKSYYPYVNQCPGGWQRVAPTPG